MGCVSSTLLRQDDEFSEIGGQSTTLSHHIVSLTSTTYGLLTLDAPSRDSFATTTMVPPTPTPGPPPARATLPSPLSEPRALRYQTLETINSWDLMSSLESDHMPSFRFSTPTAKPTSNVSQSVVVWPVNDENVSPNVTNFTKKQSIPKELDYFLEGYELMCPPNGESKVVIYTTTLRGVRKTFEDCNVVRAAIQGLGVSVCERDISMDRGFREELRELMKGKGKEEMIPPRVFVKGKYIGGVDEVMRLVEDGCVGELVCGLPKLRVGSVCKGCGGVGFLPCFTCHGSCKTVKVAEEGAVDDERRRTVVMRCGECNENGLVLCPICS